MEKSYPTWIFSYPFEGAKYNLHIKAKDADEAKRRIQALAWATLDGELYASIPVTPRAWWQRLWGKS